MQTTQCTNTWNDANNRITLHHGTAMSLMSSLKENSIDAVIADPPYGSGGTNNSSRKKTTSEKYQNSDTKKTYPDFHGDCRDQRAHEKWMIIWLEEARRVTRDGGYLMCFTDWRMLASTTDAAQVAGWTYSGIVVWDKTEQCRPQMGKFRNQCEYVVICVKGTGGRSKLEKPHVTPAGCVRLPIKSREKFHLTGKPIPLMNHLMTVLKADSLILDPFAGSSSTLIAAHNAGHRSVGSEITKEYFDISVERLIQLTNIT